MKRREFIQVAAAAAAAPGLAQAAPLGSGGDPAELDRYGGWTGRSFQPTGFFRVEKDDRWWLVTPDGNVFLSFGINHFYTDLWNQDYNREAWRKRLGVPDESAPEYYPALRAWFLETCAQYGINTVGVHNSLSVVNNPQPTLPYVQPMPFVDIPHWKPEIPDENFVDVFAPEYVAHCDGMVEERAVPIRKDPFLLGYYMTDCPLFTEEDCRERPDTIGGARRGSRIGWPRRLRNLAGSAPGKRAYVETVHELYEGQIQGFATRCRSRAWTAGRRRWTRPSSTGTPPSPWSRTRCPGPTAPSPTIWRSERSGPRSSSGVPSPDPSSWAGTTAA